MADEKKGVSLQYSGDVPRITSIARGKLLDKMINLAEKNNVAIYRDPDLTEVLSNLEIGTEIPEDLYKAVSEVLAFCYRINSDLKKKIDSL